MAIKRKRVSYGNKKISKVRKSTTQGIRKASKSVVKETRPRKKTREKDSKAISSHVKKRIVKKPRHTKSKATRLIQKAFRHKTKAKSKGSLSPGIQKRPRDKTHKPTSVRTKPLKQKRKPRFPQPKPLEKGYKPLSKKLVKEVLKKLPTRAVPERLDREIAAEKRRLGYLQRKKEARIRRRSTKAYQRLKLKLQIFDAMRRGFVKSDHEQIKKSHREWYDIKRKYRYTMSKYEWQDMMDDLGEEMGMDDEEIQSYRES